MKKILLGLFIFIILIIIATTPEASENSKTNTASVNQTIEKKDNDEVRENTFLVTKVVDGDTIKLLIDGEEKSIRLIGIDTPETVHPSKPVECFGIEASNKAKELLQNQRVKLEIDESQGEVDKYGRLLGYVILKNGKNFNKLMIEEGYAHEYTYQNNPYKYQNDFKLAEAEAKINKRGLWSPSACSQEVETE
jgi:micrococcal nuclease